MEKCVVLHIPCPYLEDVGVGADERHHLRGYHLGDDREPGFLACHGEKLQPFSAEALEAVWGGARLERPAAQDLRPSRLYGAGRIQDLGTILHSARAGHYHNLASSNSHSVYPHYRVLGVKLPAR